MQKLLKRQQLNKIERLVKAQQALELRRGGASYAEIAAKLDYPNIQMVSRHLQEAIREIVAEPAEDVKKLEVDRLDTLLAGLWRKATAEGDMLAIDRVLKLMDRRAKYLGLDAPQKVEAKISAADRFRNMPLEEQAQYLREFIPKLTADLAAIEAELKNRRSKTDDGIEVRQLGGDSDDGGQDERAGDGGESIDGSDPEGEGEPD